MSTIARTLVILLFLLSSLPSKAITYYANITGNWNALTTWTTVGCGSFINPLILPGPTDDVVICGNADLTCNINTTVNSITISGGCKLFNASLSATNRSVTIVSSLNILSGGGLVQQSILNPATTLFAGVEFF